MISHRFEIRHLMLNELGIRTCGPVGEERT
jgi:hypothetical protein